MKGIWPNLETVGVYSPPIGFEKNPDESNYILGRIALGQPDVLIVGLGAPKQEIWVHQHRDLICARIALCVGATIDFLAGEKKRAPAWMQRSGIEWLHRVCTEPKRLAKRYAKDAWVFPRLVWTQYQQNNHYQ
jgi:N-acetylglucosaminyldiphosphoundecaprenol N-acetyl-beta-D-mannosaminyltransferase